jgi:hypothetical protein
MKKVILGFAAAALLMSCDKTVTATITLENKDAEDYSVFFNNENLGVLADTATRTFEVSFTTAELCSDIELRDGVTSSNNGILIGSIDSVCLVDGISLSFPVDY